MPASQTGTNTYFGFKEEENTPNPLRAFFTQDRFCLPSELLFDISPPQIVWDRSHYLLHIIPVVFWINYFISSGTEALNDIIFFRKH